MLPLLPTLFLTIDRLSFVLLRRLAIESRAESYFLTRLKVAERKPSLKVILEGSFFRKAFLSEEVGVCSMGFSALLPEFYPEVLLVSSCWGDSFVEGLLPVLVLRPVFSLDLAVLDYFGTSGFLGFAPLLFSFDDKLGTFLLVLANVGLPTRGVVAFFVVYGG